MGQDDTRDRNSPAESAPASTLLDGILGIIEVESRVSAGGSSSDHEFRVPIVSRGGLWYTGESAGIGVMDPTSKPQIWGGSALLACPRTVREGGAQMLPMSPGLHPTPGDVCTA